MAVIAQFGELKFEISSSTALLFEKLKLSAECETEEQTNNSQQYVSAKNGKPVQVSLSIILNAALGIDVKVRATEILNAAQRSTQGYFYAGGAKVFPFKLMMTKADTEEITIDPSGRWVSTKINVTLKQSTQEWISAPSKPEQWPSGTVNWGGVVRVPKKASVNTGMPVGPTLGATSGATSGAISGAIDFLQNQSITALKKAQDSVAKASTAKTSTAAAVAASRKTTSTAKTKKSTISKPKPLTTAQKARASAKEGRILGIK